MTRRIKVRRFEPRYGVSQAAVEAEAIAIGREVDDYKLLALSDLESKRSDRHAACTRAWQHLQLVLGGMCERERMVIHAVLFRDFYHILEAYIAHLRGTHSDVPTPAPDRMKTAGAAPDRFSEWLFDPNSRKESA